MSDKMNNGSTQKGRWGGRMSTERAHNFMVDWEKQMLFKYWSHMRKILKSILKINYISESTDFLIFFNIFNLKSLAH